MTRTITQNTSTQFTLVLFGALVWIMTMILTDTAFAIDADPGRMELGRNMGWNYGDEILTFKPQRTFDENGNRVLTDRYTGFTTEFSETGETSGSGSSGIEVEVDITITQELTGGVENVNGSTTTTFENHLDVTITGN